MCSSDPYWIAGGRAKEDGLEVLEPSLHRIRKAYLIGEAQNQFATELDGKVRWQKCGDLANALAAARADTAGSPGSVVLLSPAAASFDQFKSFEERGEAFARLVLDQSATVVAAGGAG